MACLALPGPAWPYELKVHVIPFPGWHLESKKLCRCAPGVRCMGRPVHDVFAKFAVCCDSWLLKSDSQTDCHAWQACKRPHESLGLLLQCLIDVSCSNFMRCIAFYESEHSVGLGFFSTWADSGRICCAKLAA